MLDCTVVPFHSIKPLLSIESGPSHHLQLPKARVALFGRRGEESMLVKVRPDGFDAQFLPPICIAGSLIVNISGEKRQVEEAAVTLVASCVFCKWDSSATAGKDNNVVTQTIWTKKATAFWDVAELPCGLNALFFEFDSANDLPSSRMCDMQGQSGSGYRVTYHLEVLYTEAGREARSRNIPIWIKGGLSTAPQKHTPQLMYRSGSLLATDASTMLVCDDGRERMLARTCFWHLLPPCPSTGVVSLDDKE